MGGNLTVIHVADPHFVVSADRAIRCLHLLQASGAMGGPLIGARREEWRPGSLVHAQLGVEFVQHPHGPGCIRFESHDKPEVYCDPTFTVACPECDGLLYGGAADDRWSEPMTAWQENVGEEPLVICGCGARRPISRLSYVGAAVTRFAIVLEDAVRPIPDMSLPLWGQLEDILGTALSSLVYTRE